MKDVREATDDSLLELADRLPSEAGLTLRHPPREPHADLWVVATAGTIDPAWEPFLPAASL